MLAGRSRMRKEKGDEHGGHDLIEEFRGSIGKWLILEVEIH